MAQLKSIRMKHGPYVVIVTDTKHALDDDTWPMVVNGFDTVAMAQEFIDVFARRKESYLGLDFQITGVTTPASFAVFCSWED